MEEIKNGGICPITEWEIITDVIEDNGYRYTVRCSNYSYNLWVTTEAAINPVLKGQSHIVRWLLFNGKIKTVKTQVDKQNLEFVYSEERLFKLIEESFIPRTPKEKSEQLLVLLNNIFPIFTGAIDPDDLFKLSFFKDKVELEIYLDYLSDSNYVKFNRINEMVGFDDVIPFFSIDFKFQGIQKLAELEQSGKNSKNCFIAMSFSEKPEIIAIKEAIKSAVNGTKYNPIIINEKHIESDRTINDAIIAEIKRAKFVIADFTEQKAGAYFEAGFALGLGIPVIYCCEEDDFKKNSHFDVNHYPHILYKTPEQLRKGLVDKIRAWID